MNASMKFYMTASQNPEWKDRYSVIENGCFQSRGNAVLYNDSDWFYKKKGGSYGLVNTSALEFITGKHNLDSERE